MYRFGYTPTTMTLFRFFTQKVLPTVYDDSLSYLELLQKIEHYLNEVIEHVNIDSNAVLELQSFYSDLRAEFDQFKESGFDDYYREQIAEWVQENMERIIRDSMKMVFFGLSLDGHFMAYIPDSWSEIIFDTGMVYELDTYGRLILRFDVDSPYDNYDQIPEVVRGGNVYNQLRWYVENIMNTLYRP